MKHDVYINDHCGFPVKLRTPGALVLIRIYSVEVKDKIKMSLITDKLKKTRNLILTKLLIICRVFGRKKAYFHQCEAFSRETNMAVAQ